jgi:hypothetical protein
MFAFSNSFFTDLQSSLALYSSNTTGLLANPPFLFSPKKENSAISSPALPASVAG